MNLTNAVLNALIPGRAAKAAKAKADSESFRVGLKWLIGSHAIKEAAARKILPA